jgi:hypothetical protein
MKQVGHAVCMVEIRNAYQFWSENLKGGRYRSEDLGVDGRIILE